MSASVYSTTPTPVPGRRGTMCDAHGANEYGPARPSAVYTKTRVPTRTPPNCATSSPARRGSGKSTRVVDASLTVDTFVLSARRPLLTSLWPEETLASGNLHAPASARDDPHAHDAA
jgi:hypothetical protein